MLAQTNLSKIKRKEFCRSLKQVDCFVERSRHFYLDTSNFNEKISVPISLSQNFV